MVDGFFLRGRILCNAEDALQMKELAWKSIFIFFLFDYQKTNDLI